MAQAKKDNRIILSENQVLDNMLEGAKAVFDAVSSTYGPKGKNVLLEKTYGRPILTRDGVTVAKEVYFSDRPKNMAAQLITEASQTTNAVAGDGTTATVVLTYFLIKEGARYVGSGDDPMTIRNIISDDAARLLDEIKEIATPVADGQLEQVATVSSGDPNLGKLIAEAIEYVGPDGGIITEKAHLSGVEREYVEGYYMQRGFTAITEGRRELDDPYVVATSKRISSNADALELLKYIASTVQMTEGQPLRVALIGEIEGEAYNTIVTNIQHGVIDAVIVQTPPAGAMSVQYLEDIAIYTGGTLISEGGAIKGAVIGKARKVVCTQNTTTIFGGQYDEDKLKERLAKLEERLSVEENEFLSEKISDRISKLKGKIAIFRIGGSTDTEKEEKEFRIEDAIQATKAASRHGVVPGGGTTLVYLSNRDGLSSLFKNALQNTFRRLMQNANLPGDVKLNELNGAAFGHGFNLRKDDKLVNLVKEGILDPALVVEQVIENASSIAGNALTTGTMVVFEDRDE